MPGVTKLVVSVESALIIEYPCNYYGPGLMPPKHTQGGRLGLESEARKRNRFYLVWREGRGV